MVGGRGELKESLVYCRKVGRHGPPVRYEWQPAFVLWRPRSCKFGIHVLALLCLSATLAALYCIAAADRNCKSQTGAHKTKQSTGCLKRVTSAAFLCYLHNH